LRAAPAILLLLSLGFPLLAPVVFAGSEPELPLNSRDFAQLALLEPGVTPSRR
jgi:hypothetical protein